jgi:hypothetical protein
MAVAEHRFADAQSLFAEAEAAGGPVERIAPVRAAVAALAGDPATAGRHLGRAFRAGMRGCDVFKDAPELKPFRDTPELRQLMAVCRERPDR